MMTEMRQIDVAASPEVTFETIQRLGGETGWLFADGLWRLRGRLDRLLGGPGFRRGRPHPTELRVGDPVDFWRVEAIDPGRSLCLRAEMKLPGDTWITFEVHPLGRRACRVIQRTTYVPRGLRGRLYWYATLLPHRWVFDGLMRALKARAEAAERAADRADGPDQP